MAAAPPPYRPRKGVRVLRERDERLAQLFDRIRPIAIAQKPSTFESIARSIVYQQLSGRAAETIWQRLLACFDGGNLEPAAVLRKRTTTLRKAGLSGAKTESLRDLARHVRSGALRPERLGELDDDAVIEALTRVRGIGPWSAHMHLIFALARPDVWPTGDLGVRKGLRLFFDLDDVPTAQDAEALGEGYRPWRTLLAWSMWRIHDVEKGR